MANPCLLQAMGGAANALDRCARPVQSRGLRSERRLGYIDDDAYARGKSRDLTARGYGARRVEQALWAAGVEEQVRSDNAPGEAESRRAAVLLAKKRRFGPFGIRPDEDAPVEERRKLREKQVAAMLRAGHLYDHVRFILDASAEDEIEEWLEEAEDDGSF